MGGTTADPNLCRPWDRLTPVNTGGEGGGRGDGHHALLGSVSSTACRRLPALGFAPLSIAQGLFGREGRQGGKENANVKRMTCPR